MKKLTDIKVIREIMQRHGFRFSKSLGQNFIINPDICPRMANSCAATDRDTVVEIGPGIGVLTRELSAVSKKVIAIEVDSSLIPVLDETLGDLNNVEIIHGDIMNLRLGDIIRERAVGDLYVCANLPYYITSPVIMSLLESSYPIKSITVMVQKEAATRLCAVPGTRECGAVSAGVRYRSTPKILFNVNKGSFFPPPKVDSCVIRFDILSNPPVNAIDESFFFKVVRAAFSQRRKTAANSISSVLKIDKGAVVTALKEAGIPTTSRAEALSLKELCSLANRLLAML